VTAATTFRAVEPALAALPAESILIASAAVVAYGFATNSP
jgi:hypothetical protein